MINIWFIKIDNFKNINNIDEAENALKLWNFQNKKIILGKLTINLYYNSLTQQRMKLYKAIVL